MGFTKINGLHRWDQKAGKGGKGGMRCTYRTQKAGNPRKLAFQTRKDGFGCMVRGERMVPGD